MKKWIGMSLGFIGVVVIIGLLIAGNYLYNESVKRGTEVELYRGDEEAAPAGASLTTDTEDSVVSEAERWFDQQEMSILEQTSFDNLLLRAAFINNKNSNGKAVILAHGFRKQKEDMKDLAYFYYQQGFDILLPDTRGHGESEGNYIGYGWHDRLDYLNWIDRLIHDYKSESIFLHGQSMGAALVLMVSGEKLPNEVKGIIADSGYTSVKEELAYQLKHIYGLPSFPLLNIASVITKVRSGYFFGEASAIDQVENNTRPLLIIHGEKDELVPTEMAHTIYETAGGEKMLWTVPNAGHIQSCNTQPQQFEKKLKEFITNVLHNK